MNNWIGVADELLVSIKSLAQWELAVNLQLLSLKMFTAFVFLVLTAGCFANPEVLPSVTIQEGANSSFCPETTQARNDTSSAIRSILRNTVVPRLDRQSCQCGGPGWTRIAHLNMSDPNQQCPPNWRLISTPERGCSRTTTSSNSCDSDQISVGGQFYSRVCGRVNAHPPPSCLKPSLTKPRYLGTGHLIFRNWQQNDYLAIALNLVKFATWAFKQV